jgi:hypothetical protein
MEEVRAVLPISGSDWEVIESTHSQYFPDRERTWEQLKKKFWNLANKRIPTGDPNMPWEVQEAKSIRLLIIERTDGARGSPSEEFEFAREDDSEAEEGAIGAVFGDEEGGAAEAPAANNQAGAPIPPRYVPNFHLGNSLSRVHVNHDEQEYDLQDPEQSRRRSHPTPITRRNQRARRDDSPSFTQVMMLMMNQQNAEREEAREERRIRQQEQAAAMQMQQTMMSSMMMVIMRQLGPNPAPAAVPLAPAATLPVPVVPHHAAIANQIDDTANDVNDSEEGNTTD